MLSVDDLVRILNKKLTKGFLESALDLSEDEDYPIDPEHPEMELILEDITDEINECSNSLPIKDDYDR